MRLLIPNPCDQGPGTRDLRDYLSMGVARTGRPVKMVMTREEVFRATGPTSGANLKVKLGCTTDGKITAAQAELNFQAGAFGGSPIAQATMCAFTRYDLANVHVVGHDVTSNRPKVAAYRAPGAPIAALGPVAENVPPIVMSARAAAGAKAAATESTMPAIPLARVMVSSLCVIDAGRRRRPGKSRPTIANASRRRNRAELRGSGGRRRDIGAIAGGSSRL